MRYLIHQKQVQLHNTKGQNTRRCVVIQARDLEHVPAAFLEDKTILHVVDADDATKAVERFLARTQGYTPIKNARPAESPHESVIILEYELAPRR